MKMSSKMFKRILFTIVGVFFGMVVLGHIVGPKNKSSISIAGAQMPAAQPDRGRQHREREAAEIIKRLDAIKQSFREICYKVIVLLVLPRECERMRDAETWNGITRPLLASVSDQASFNRMVAIVHEFEREVGRIQFEAWTTEGRRNR